jgi:protein SCO1/2
VKAVLVAMLALSAACQRPQPPLEIFGTVPAFELTAHTGEPFHSASLDGRVWVADFIYTNCTGPCPRMTTQMGLVQRAVRDLPDVKLVSFTVDPKRDTPEVLAAYAKRYGADAGRWWFVTGSIEKLHKLSLDAFRLGNVDGSLDHSTRFVLVDRMSRVRGYYLTSEEDAVSRVTADIRRLVKERG